ncbi:UNVERIFIED_CONTAM: hypothetical protein GTU68_015202 [Idotea baltica]|nr:hypothetical protein [Idotea baltica]
MNQAPTATNLPFTGGIIGYLSYDFSQRIQHLKPAFTTNGPHAQDDAYIGLYDWALVTDHLAHTSQLVFHSSVTPKRRQEIIVLFEENHRIQQESFKLIEPFKADITPTEYHQSIDKIQKYIKAGDCYQVNFAQRFSAKYTGCLWSAYKQLRKTSAAPFSSYQSFSKNCTILSLSPERFLKVSNKHVETRPIKGTCPRGVNKKHDLEQKKTLVNSKKDRAENLMIVDLLRNDLSRICQIGSIKTPELFRLESYSNVHHLVSIINGLLPQQKDPLDLLISCFPGGSITGAPKIRAMQIIQELEHSPRDIYCGSVFYLDTRGNMDSSITIRTLFSKEEVLYCWGGGGIIHDSLANTEYAESLTKITMLLRTLDPSYP